jgi:hypothetical protein
MADHITSIGISLGNDLQNVQSSVLLIKDMERGRIVLVAKSRGVESANPGVVEVADLDDSDVEINQETLNHLCGDLTEEILDIAVTEHTSIYKFHIRRKNKVDKLSNSHRKVGTKKKIIFQ